MRVRGHSLGLPVSLVVQQGVDAEGRLLPEVCQGGGIVVGYLALDSYVLRLDAVACEPGDVVVGGFGTDRFLGVEALGGAARAPRPGSRVAGGGGPRGKVSEL